MRQYGLIGFPLAHSFSKAYFEKKFIREGITDARFDLFPIENIEQLSDLIQSNKDLKGIAITIPYKKQVLRFLDTADEMVAAIGACNCIKIVDGKLYGYNTDVTGFRNSLEKILNPQLHTNALILGTGGASLAIEFALKELNIAYQLVSRSKSDKNLCYEDLNEAIISSHTIIINTTPLGTYPNIETFPLIPYHLLTAKHLLYDLVYNPTETLFLRKGKAQGAVTKNGYEMLELQAELNWKIWCGGENNNINQEISPDIQ